MAKLRPVLFTKEALKDEWEGTEWFGSDFSHAPYWEICDSSFGYGYYENGSVEFECDKILDYILVYKEGEFLCSFEFSPPPMQDSVITISNISSLRKFLKC